MKMSTVKKLNNQVRKAVEFKGLANGSTGVVAVSGGPDSLALLYSLKDSSTRSGFKLHGAHLNHELRGKDSDDDAQYVHGIFHDLNISHTVAKEKVIVFKTQQRISSTEEAARNVRYRFLAKVARNSKAELIATGHTSDDQVETVLMHFLRGSGLHGLRGMKEYYEGDFYGIQSNIFRPLLSISRSDTESYCNSLGIEPRYDKTNLSTDIIRNKIRLELMPQLKLYNPAIKESVLRLSRLATIDSNYIQSAVSAVLPNIGVYDGKDQAFTVDKKAFTELPMALKGHVIRRIILIIKNNLKDLGHCHIDSVIKMICGPAGKTFNLPSGMIVTIGYNTATIGFHDPTYCPLPKLNGEHKIDIPGETKIGSWIICSTFTRQTEPLNTLSKSNSDNISVNGLSPNTTYDAIFDSASMNGTILVRTRRDGDRFQPLGMINTKKLQDFMVDSKIPRACRDRVPLVVSSKGIAWVVGWRHSNWARAKDDGRDNLMLSFSYEN